MENLRKNNTKFILIATLACALVVAFALCVSFNTSPAFAKVKRPAKAKIASVKVINTHKVKVTVKKVKKAKGYQVKIATNKQFTKNLKTKTSKAKTKTFSIAKTSSTQRYIKARAYKKSGGKKVYGKWSKVKRVKFADVVENANANSSDKTNTNNNKNANNDDSNNADNTDNSKWIKNILTVYPDIAEEDIELSSKLHKLSHLLSQKYCYGYMACTDGAYYLEIACSDILQLNKIQYATVSTLNNNDQIYYDDRNPTANPFAKEFYPHTALAVYDENGTWLQNISCQGHSICPDDCEYKLYS